MGATQRLSLPYIAAGQAQKEVTHNEALQLLDVIVAGAVEQPPLSAPPATPAPGSCYLVGAGPTGPWAGQANRVAAYTSGGWRFVAPADGMAVVIKSSGLTASYRTGVWAIGDVTGARLLMSSRNESSPRALTASHRATVRFQPRPAAASTRQPCATGPR